MPPDLRHLDPAFQRIRRRPGQCKSPVVSADLPFAAQRFCTLEGLDLSSTAVPPATPVPQELGRRPGRRPLVGLPARAVRGARRKRQGAAIQMVGEIADEPDYAAAPGRCNGRKSRFDLSILRRAGVGGTGVYGIRCRSGLLRLLLRVRV